MLIVSREQDVGWGLLFRVELFRSLLLGTGAATAKSQICHTSHVGLVVTEGCSNVCGISTPEAGYKYIMVLFLTACLLSN